MHMNKIFLSLIICSLLATAVPVAAQDSLLDRLGQTEAVPATERPLLDQARRALNVRENIDVPFRAPAVETSRHGDRKVMETRDTRRDQIRDASTTRPMLRKERIEAAPFVPSKVRARMIANAFDDGDTAREALAERLRNLGTLDERLKRLALVGGEKITSEIEERRTRLLQLRENLQDRELTVEERRELIQANRAYSQTVPKAAAVAAADRVLATALQLTQFSDKIDARIAEASVDTSEAERYLASMNGHIANAEDAANEALAILETVDTDASDDASFAENKRKLHEARNLIASAHAELGAAKADARKAVNSLKGAGEE